MKGLLAGSKSYDALMANLGWVIFARGLGLFFIHDELAIRVSKEEIGGGACVLVTMENIVIGFCGEGDARFARRFGITGFTMVEPQGRR
ncbi:uncharacterized protein HKW66_Vig0116790 [Vigna angularis]|uniref:Uncharacterized protein n=1 Tax=Phaseolus angularis TaxID=3914 RepID=A0A8T0JVD5_PHAAN|nr:uncharacterized protein HKW66_Vig0116790 [Vigna angularis]